MLPLGSTGQEVIGYITSFRAKELGRCLCLQYLHSFGGLCWITSGSQQPHSWFIRGASSAPSSLFPCRGYVGIPMRNGIASATFACKKVAKMGRDHAIGETADVVWPFLYPCQSWQMGGWGPLLWEQLLDSERLQTNVRGVQYPLAQHPSTVWAAQLLHLAR